MAETNVPAVEITETGVSVPETSNVLAGVLLDYNSAFGGNLNITSVSTPQAYLAGETTACIMAVNAALAYIFNNVDPAYASGRFQDAIARIYFITRNPATSTVVYALCSGSPGATLSMGSKAKDANGYTYTSMQHAVFGSDGQVTVPFKCDTPGAVPCAAGSLTQILIASSGWDAITNETAGIVGNPVENREDFENRRYNSVAINATGTVPAIRSAVMQLDGVTDCFVVDNPENETIQYGVTNYNLLPHSVYVAVVGGDNQEIAKTIWRKKDVGCDYNGNTTETVFDDSALAAPYPEYKVTFNRPNPVTIYFAIKIKKNNSLPSNIVDLIKAQVVAAFNGAVDGVARERMASSIYASRYYAVVSAVDEEINILSIDIGTESANGDAVDLGIDQYPTVSADNIEVTLA